MTDPAPLDFPTLLAEIDTEVARRRASGELPHDFERRLDRAFALHAPVDAIDAGFDSVVDWIEGSAVIDTRPPTVSAYPGVAQVKQIVAKATAFELRHLASQVTGLFQGVGRALRMLNERIDRLEHESVGPPAPVAVPSQAAPSLSPEWEGFVLDALRGRSGRVLHADAGDGRLIGQLLAAGLDAYGVEPSEQAVFAASERVPDVRADEVLAHLRTLPVHALGGLVLSGCVERLDPGSLVELVGLAASRLAPGGTIVAISAHPATWMRSGPPLSIDLGPGRPLHPETWQAVLSQHGFVGTAVELAEPPLKLPAVPGPAEVAAVTNANFSRLIEAALGPAGYAVTATTAN